jgi:hypothetical protein
MASATSAWVIPARLRACLSPALSVAGNRCCRITMCRGREEGLQLRSVERRERATAGGFAGALGIRNLRAVCPVGRVKSTFQNPWRWVRMYLPYRYEPRASTRRTMEPSGSPAAAASVPAQGRAASLR